MDNSIILDDPKAKKTFQIKNLIFEGYLVQERCGLDSSNFLEETLYFLIYVDKLLFFKVN